MNIKNALSALVHHLSISLSFLLSWSDTLLSYAAGFEGRCSLIDSKHFQGFEGISEMPLLDIP